MPRPHGRPLLRPTTLEKHARPRHTPLLTVPDTGPLTFACLNDDLVLIATHYDESVRRVTYCPQTRDCWACRKGWTPRVCGYIPVVVYPSRRQFLMTIPQGAYEYSPELQARNGKLRGTVVTVNRLTRSSRGPVKATVDERRVSSAELPTGWDVLEDLAVRWNLDIAGR